MSPLHAFLAGVVRAFCTLPAEREEFIQDNHAVLSGLAPDEKRALWAVMKEVSV
jgi:hypothetical protein